ncbi:glucose-6-phosphate isomerase [Accumulibacter sp.]|uniref:glucose-6-phosphate isomerase n=1 Tax=Accumulibacter sp. TaxID=2053492 RepID=UPI0028C459ED|nr:glucose-6-phosphate isomerase [Accumulibacter sp.]
MTITASAAWKAIETHRQSLSPVHLRQLFASDPDRVAALSLSFEGIFFDFSKQRMDSTTLDLLLGLTREAGLAESTARMFGGEKINVSEDRSVLHVALRRSSAPFPSADFDVMSEVLPTRQRMAAFADRIRSGQALGFTGLPIRNVVNIGIGGSDLGPKMLGYALRSLSHPTLDVHYVSNLDSAQLAPLLQTLDPRTTLFLVASKTFTTQETMLNAQTARDWLVANLGDAAAVAQHFAALTAKPERAVGFGIREDAVFPLWDWVGGRFSLWSAVGLALMIAIGPQAFADLLAGAERMDEHFRNTPFERNLPVVMALIGIWNTNFLGATTNAVLPYNESLKYLPSFLQQLEMESNGKSVGIDGQPLDHATNPIVWGELGNNGQHAFFQLLHQGGRLVPCDFIAAARSDFPLPGHQEALLANCFAQSAALAFGKTADEARSELSRSMSPAALEQLLPHKVFVGNQPSSTLMLSCLDPQTLGALIALYEHKVFVQGIIWGLNSFDQWGVELGKAVASSILPAIADPLLAEKLDASTRGLLAYTRQHLA